MQKDPDFYKRMLEAKERKRKALEQKRLRDEFIIHESEYQTPIGPVIVKTEAEQKMDIAFQQVKDKLHKEHPTKQDLIQQEIQRLQNLTQGF